MAITLDLRHVSFEGRPVSESRLSLGESSDVLAERKATIGCRTARHGAGLAIARRGVAPRVDEPAHGFVGWVLDRARLDAGPYRHQPLLRRLPACLRALKVHSPEEARRLLERRPDLLPTAVDALLIGVTEFFRDPAVFEVVRTQVLPAFARRGRPVCVWSAGCSSGEELYSLAILLAEAGLLPGSSLLGTDCRGEAIAHARAAGYRAAAVRALPPEIREKYFQPLGHGFRVVEPLRNVRWEVARLGGALPDDPWDIILWRNVAIYLNPRPADLIWRRLAQRLAPGGVMIVGKAERPPSGLGLATLGRCVYRKSSASPGDTRVEKADA